MVCDFAQPDSSATIQVDHSIDARGEIGIRLYAVGRPALGTREVHIQIDGPGSWPNRPLLYENTDPGFVGSKAVHPTDNINHMTTRIDECTRSIGCDGRGDTRTLGCEIITTITASFIAL